MTRIKIISDPYKRNVEFEAINNFTKEWECINSQNSPDSKLIKEDIKNNFFPYKIVDILKILINEFASGDDPLQIIFEGTADEYLELEEASKGFENIELQKSDRMIQNARDILPRIREIYSKIQPIVDENITEEETRQKIAQNIAKYVDASNDIVPICVLGNYSSGKSTFINALIGFEILPSGDIPVTAKVYRISQLSEEDQGEIGFTYNGKEMKVTISGQEHSVDCDEDNELKSGLESVLQNEASSSLEKKVNQCLEVINKQRDEVSKLVDVKVPFAKGVLTDAENSFVIFDTPGSNVASFQDHIDILHDAMADLSNGIPIFVAELNSLDTCDNEQLYKTIKGTSQIDDRFTMIVVNKADNANIRDYTEEMIMNESIPRNLYSGGIYFVSSIMGLGAKKGGVFLDEHADELFDMNKLKYCDPSSKWYKMLYKYNIMPSQIKDRIIMESDGSDNAVLANSGLLAVEQEIVNFAEKYSAYDKCKQSDRFIDRIVEATQKEIDSKKTEREQIIKVLNEQLEDDKKELIQTVEEKSKELFERYEANYDTEMQSNFEQEQFSYSHEQLKRIERGITQKKQDEHDYSQKGDDVKKAGAAIIDDFTDIRKQGVVETIKEIGTDIKTTLDNAQKWNAARIESDKETADELVNLMTNSYSEQIDIAMKNIDQSSRDLWERKAEETKNALLMIVENSPTIEDDKKKELSDIILTYGSISFVDERVFKRAEFEKRLWLLGRVIHLNKINTRKLTDSYNYEYATSIDRIYKKLRRSHRVSFDDWREQLVDKIRNNIVNYSPKLSAQAVQIDEENKVIANLKRAYEDLTDYSEQIDALMDWKY